MHSDPAIKKSTAHSSRMHMGHGLRRMYRFGRIFSPTSPDDEQSEQLKYPSPSFIGRRVTTCQRFVDHAQR
jgi:hypothetical protein